MNWESVIGLEIHVQLATNSKIFSGASTSYGAEPNAQACAVDLGLPGVLPVLNERAIEMAIKFGLAIGAKINLHSVFDRKNYFYPDLPKGYQISQFETPIVGEGSIVIALEDGQERTVGITRAHLEEDAGKSIHDLFPGQTGIDLNRTGTPLTRNCFGTRHSHVKRGLRLFSSNAHTSKVSANLRWQPSPRQHALRRQRICSPLRTGRVW